MGVYISDDLKLNEHFLYTIMIKKATKPLYALLSLRRRRFNNCHLNIYLFNAYTTDVRICITCLGGITRLSLRYYRVTSKTRLAYYLPWYLL